VLRARCMDGRTLLRSPLYHFHGTCRVTTCVPSRVEEEDRHRHLHTLVCDVPCARMVSVFVWEPENLEGIIKQCAYVVYPPEGPKPPSQDEMRKIIEANRKKRLD